MYKLDQEIKTYYLNCPLPEHLQHKIGEEVKIKFMDTGEVIATFIVETTDEYVVTGKINWLKEGI